MGKSVRVSDEVYKRLQALATPFKDTPNTVIVKLLDYYDATKEVDFESNSD